MRGAPFLPIVVCASWCFAACGSGESVDGGTDAGAVDTGADLATIDAPPVDAPADTAVPTDAGTDAATPAPGEIGAPCSADGDCHGSGATAFCFLSGPRPEFPSVPNGYCAQLCAPSAPDAGSFDPASCPTGTGCTFVPMHGRTCMRRCATDADCRASEGYQCAVNSFAVGDTALLCLPPLDLTGEACVPSEADCGHENVDGGMQECLTDSPPASGFPSFPSGYCSSTCVFSSPCGARSTCLPFPARGPTCFRNCAHDTDCRAGYGCMLDPAAGTFDAGTVCFPIADAGP